MLREFLRQIGKLFTWIVLVAPWEQALRVRLGKHVHLLEAGIYLRIPFADRIYRQSIRRRLAVLQPQTLTTKDGKAVTITAAVGFAVDNLERLYRTLHAPEDTIAAEVEAMISQFVPTSAFEDCTPSDIEAHVSTQLDLKKYGLIGQEFYITGFAAVRTYRFITGEAGGGAGGSRINTERYDGNEAY